MKYAYLVCDEEGNNVCATLNADDAREIVEEAEILLCYKSVPLVAESYYGGSHPLADYDEEDCTAEDADEEA